MSHITAPLITYNNCEKEIVPILCDIMGGINPDESISKMLEHIKLKGHLNA